MLEGIFKNLFLEDCHTYRELETTTNNTKQGTVINPLKNKTNYGWHFEQQVYNIEGIARAIKAGGGSGNIPKILCDNIEKTFLKPKENKGKEIEKEEIIRKDKNIQLKWVI